MADLCTLMDTRHRLQRSDRRDGRKLEALVSLEQRRKRRSSSRLGSRLGRVAELCPQSGAAAGLSMSGNTAPAPTLGPNPDPDTDTDPSLGLDPGGAGGVLAAVLGGLDSRYRAEMGAVAAARQEEERALRAYEAARQRHVAAATVAARTESAFAAIQDRRSQTLKLAGMRAEMETYNFQSSSVRVSVLSSVQRLLQHLSTAYTKDTINREAKDMQERLFSWWMRMMTPASNGDGAGSVEDQDQDQDQLCIIGRVGLEIGRLGRRLLLPAAARDRDQESYDAFEREAQTLLYPRASAEAASSAPPLAPPLVPATDPGPDLGHSTVVLYFDHLVHGTPPDHIESAAR